jgi:hypothetical protein
MRSGGAPMDMDGSAQSMLARLSNVVLFGRTWPQLEDVGATAAHVGRFSFARRLGSCSHAITTAAILQTTEETPWSPRRPLSERRGVVRRCPNS